MNEKNERSLLSSSGIVRFFGRWWIPIAIACTAAATVSACLNFYFAEDRDYRLKTVELANWTFDGALIQFESKLNRSVAGMAQLTREVHTLLEVQADRDPDWFDRKLRQLVADSNGSFAVVLDSKGNVLQGYSQCVHSERQLRNLTSPNRFSPQDEEKYVPAEWSANRYTLTYQPGTIAPAANLRNIAIIRDALADDRHYNHIEKVPAHLLVTLGLDKQLPKQLRSAPVLMVMSARPYRARGKLIVAGLLINGNPQPVDQAVLETGFPIVSILAEDMRVTTTLVAAGDTTNRRLLGSRVSPAVVANALKEAHLYRETVPIAGENRYVGYMPIYDHSFEKLGAQRARTIGLLEVGYHEHKVFWKDLVNRDRALANLFWSMGSSLLVGVVAVWGVLVAQNRLQKLQQEALREATATAERARIFRDVHDKLKSAYVGTLVQLEQALNHLGSGEEAARQHILYAIDASRQGLNHAQNSLRIFREKARPASGFADDLRRCVERTLQGAVSASFEAEGQEVPLPLAMRLEMLGIAQEAMSNILEHAGASSVRMHLSYQPQRVLLRIEDDGCGFDDRLTESAEHSGITNMRHRAAALQGQLQIRSCPGGGTAILLVVPLEAVKQHEYATR